MKKLIISICISIAVALCISQSVFYVYQIKHNEKQAKMLVKKAYLLISKNNEHTNVNECVEIAKPTDNTSVVIEGNNNRILDEGTKETAYIDENQQSNNNIENYVNVYTEQSTSEIGTEDKNNSKYSDIAKTQVILDDNIIGILNIPKINVNAPIQDGTSQVVMKTSIGHFTESNYWNGNVALASHNGGTNAHYFENLKNLKEGDEIEYITKIGIKKYRVIKIFAISSCDWTEVVSTKENEAVDNSTKDSNQKNTITLVTCINGKPKSRLCVKGEEV